MTRKDYEIIARAVASYVTEQSAQAQQAADEVDSDDLFVIVKRAKVSGARSVARVLAQALAADNPRFDGDRFLQACGVRATT